MENKTIEDLITLWPQFVQYLILNDIISFNHLISFAQTCKKVNECFYNTIKIYKIFCENYNPNYGIVKIHNLYNNSLEFELFIKIYTYSKKKILIDDASKFGSIPILNWYLFYALENLGYSTKSLIKYFDNKYSNQIVLKKKDTNTILNMKYTNDAIDLTSMNNHVNVMDWWYNNYVKLKRSNIELLIKYSHLAIDSASEYENINMLNWWINHSKYVLDEKEYCMILIYSSWSIDYASRYSKIKVLDWWFENSLKYSTPENNFELKYTEWSVNSAAESGRIDILNWWYNHCSKKWLKINYPNFEDRCLEFKYTDWSNDSASNKGYIEILEWFLDRSLNSYNNSLPFIDPDIKLEFKYSEYSVIKASVNSQIKVLDWWYNYATKKLQEKFQQLKIINNHENDFKYNAHAIDWAAENGHIKSIEWFYNHSSEERLKLIKAPYYTVINNAGEQENKYLILDFEFTTYAMDSIFSKNQIGILDWFFNHSNKCIVNGFELRYTEKSMDDASKSGLIEILDWWYNHSDKCISNGVELKYSHESFNHASAHGYVEVLDWWYNHSTICLGEEKGIKLKYASDVLFLASCYKHIDVLNWFYNHMINNEISIGLPFVSEKYINSTYAYEICTWWKNSGLLTN